MFFLLASFMMVSLSQVHMKGMKVESAHRRFGRNPKQEGLRQSFGRRDGYVYFDKKKMALEELHQTLVQMHQADPDAKDFRAR